MTVNIDFDRVKVMKVLICDPADIDAIKYLKKNGLKVDFRPDISASNLLSEVNNYQALLVRSRTKVTKDVIDRGKLLKVIGRIGSGYDNIDIEACKTRKISVINSPDANSQAVAELTVSLIISILRKTELAYRSMREGKWLKNEIWGHELAGKTVGILGYGYVGKRVAKLLRVFDVKLLIYSKNFSTATLEEIFSMSDIVTIHLVLNKHTENLVGINLLNKMKKDAYLINLSRGKIIDEEALYKVISTGKIAGAALDVYRQEPLPVDSKWRKLNNVLLTPHIGAATHEALAKASMTLAEDIVRIYTGKKPKYQVI